MDFTVKSSPLSRVIALIVVTFVLAWLLHRFDARTLRRIDTMPSVDFANYERHLHGHSYLFTFVSLLLTGGVYLAVIEILALLAKALTQKSRA